MSESCRPIVPESLIENNDHQEDDENPDRSEYVISVFLALIGLVLIATAIFCIRNLPSNDLSLNSSSDQNIHPLPSAPSLQLHYEKQPSRNPLIGKK